MPGRGFTESVFNESACFCVVVSTGIRGLATARLSLAVVALSVTSLGLVRRFLI